MRIISLAVMTAASVSLLGCQTREVTEFRAPSSAGGKVIFSDDFERAELGPNWHRGVGEAGNGKWTIAGGKLTGRVIKNDPLWLKTPLPARVRVEFDATAKSADGDLKFEIFGDGQTHASGYVGIFGGWKNSLDVIARLDEHGKDRKAQKARGVEQNRTYRMAVERVGGKLDWFVDGTLVMSYDDPEPLMGEAHRFFAFNDWAAPVEFDNLLVKELP